MRIYPPPVRELIPSNNWNVWFDLVFKAILSFNGLQKVLSTTATLDFPNIAAQSTQTLTVALTGAKLDAANPARVVLGYAVTMGIIYDGYVSADDVVTVRAMNFTAGAINPASSIFSITVFQY